MAAQASSAPRPQAQASSAPRLEIFYASDFHGSERVFRKFLNAAAFYKVRAVVFGGDLTGKAIIPFVETGPGQYQAEVFGAEHNPQR